MYSFFDEDLDHLTECNLDSLDEACNTAVLDIEELTIIDSLPHGENELPVNACHLSRLSRLATDDKDDFEMPWYVKTDGFITIVEGGSLYNQTWGIK